ncbi:23S rRNA (uracil747-C5)-methyltransferase [Leucobacter exalbidus]|uniref:23S rRNA (Uracil747-C5)-methyltransferase n=1 Tax=Leucobacter exalbidus TaxID=662960 RepID=A0A940T2P5_9MICO|nr:methyltransferase domain-containing protein [Leucobacter exalbidus]MBP1324809.1 23S rRNA (uracil747-C5)-methyltransferase [Leucobacter exalbidus]
MPQPLPLPTFHPDQTPLAAPAPDCAYFDAGACRSCALIETPYAQQLRAKEDRCRALLPGVAAEAWLESVAGGVRGFRNKAKLVVGGEAGHVTLGILGPDGHGVDLRECLIQSPEIHAAIPAIARLLEESGLAPYDVPGRRGELKFVHVTSSPTGQLMLRFVVRTAHAADRLAKLTQRLTDLVPNVEAASVNLLPEHKAVLEGDEERALIGSSLTMQLGNISLHLLPRSFFQTNTPVARALYAQAAEWVAEVQPASLWDLYCGVGGFALHCAPAGQGASDLSGDSGSGSASQHAPVPSGTAAVGPVVTGVEISEAAVASAQRSARDAAIDARFIAADATAFALGSSASEAPEMVIVNPPRRGIGADLAGWLEQSQINHVIYSSCNPESLARDLAAMPGFTVRRARVFDMFPHTAHLEAMLLLERV